MSFALRARVFAPTTARFTRQFSATTPSQLARISLIGRLADTPEVQATSTGHEIVKYSVATNSGPKDNRKTSWFAVTSFEGDGPRRDLLTSLGKGSMIYVDGDATMDTYQDAEGKTRKSLSIVQRNYEVLVSPRDQAPTS